MQEKYLYIMYKCMLIVRYMQYACEVNNTLYTMR